MVVALVAVIATGVHIPLPGGTAAAAEPVAGGLIAFESDRHGGDLDVWVMGVDGSKPSNLTAGSPADEMRPAWSPDGRRLAFVRATGSGDDREYDIWTMRADGSDQVNLTAGWAPRARDPAWSPDGSTIAFSSSSAATEQAGIFLMDADGSNVRLLHDTAASDQGPVFSPDGRTLGVTGILVGIGTTFATARVIANEGHDPGLAGVVEAWDDAPHHFDGFSPDGERIVFTRSHSDETETGSEIFVAGADDLGNDEPGVNLTGSVGRHEQNGGFSPDGSLIVFDANPEPQPCCNYINDIFVIDARGDVANLTDHPADDGHPAWQPTPPLHGYFVLEEDGEIYAFGDARPLLKQMDGGSRDDSARAATISSTFRDRLSGSGARAASLVLTEDNEGLWVLLSNGQVWSLGAAPTMPGVPAGVMTKTVAGQPEQVAAMARLGDGALWVFTSAGRVVPQSGGGLPAAVQEEMDVVLGLDLLGPVIDAKPTADGRGVLALASDGGVFTYNAQGEFLGSVWDAIAERLAVPVGSVGPDRPVVGLTMDPDGDGYWISAEDGGVFAMRGRSPFRGSLPAIVPFDQLLAPIGGMVPFGNGYLLVGKDGGVFNFSDKPFAGSASGLIDTEASALATI